MFYFLSFTKNEYCLNLHLLECKHNFFCGIKVYDYLDSLFYKVFKQIKKHKKHSKRYNTPFR